MKSKKILTVTILIYVMGFVCSNLSIAEPIQYEGLSDDAILKIQKSSQLLEPILEKSGKESCVIAALVNYLQLRNSKNYNRDQILRIASGTETAFLFETFYLMKYSMSTDLEIPEEDRRILYMLYDCLYQLTPVGLWGMIYNAKSTEELSILVDPSPPVVPMPNRDILKKIAMAFENAGVWDLAWRAYTEMILGTYSAPEEGKRNTWLDGEAVKYWIKVADCAYKSGNVKIASDFLYKFTFFCSDNETNQIQKVICDWTNSNHVSAKVPYKIRRQHLNQAVNCYEQINAHPRAFRLFEEYPDMFDNAVVKRVERSWIKVAKKSALGRKKCLLYGVEVYPDFGDPLDIRIPWAFSDEAVKSVRKRLKDLNTVE